MSSVVISGDTSGTVTISAPAVAGTPTLTLPTLTGTVSLTTKTVQVFTSASGTYTTPTGCKAIWVRCLGGGGGGGASATNPGASGVIQHLGLLPQMAALVAAAVHLWVAPVGVEAAAQEQMS